MEKVNSIKTTNILEDETKINGMLNKNNKFSEMFIPI